MSAPTGHASVAKAVKPSPQGYEAVVSLLPSGEVEVGSVKVGCVQAVEYNALAVAGLERRSSISVGEMGHHIEVRADPVELDDILSRMEIGDPVELNRPQPPLTYMQELANRRLDCGC